MTVYPTIATQDRTSQWWLLGGIVVVVAVLALASVGTFAFRGGNSKLAPVHTGVASSVRGTGMSPIMALTPARLAAGALGTGYQLPRAQHGPTIASVLASMDPKTRRYTEKIMALTFTQLAAGAAGHP
jgi:hypothetical protein